MSQKLKYANRILGMSIAILLIYVLQNINFYNIADMSLISAMFFRIFVSIVRILMLASFPLHFIILVYVKKLRQTDRTRLLYNIIIGIHIVNIVYTLIVLILSYTLQPSSSYNWSITFQSVFSNIIRYASLVLYVAVVFKEGKNYNWMFIGYLLASTTGLLRQLTIFLIRFTGNGIILTGNYLETHHPAIAFILRGYFVSIATSMLWIVGAILVAAIYKVNVKKQIMKDNLNISKNIL